jgi:hypothetical protein
MAISSEAAGRNAGGFVLVAGARYEAQEGSRTGETEVMRMRLTPPGKARVVPKTVQPASSHPFHY